MHVGEEIPESVERPRWEAEIGAIRVLFGPGSLQQLGPEVRRLGGSRVLLVTDHGIRTAGHLDEALDSLNREALEPLVFDGVSENPTTEEVEAGRAAAAGNEIDLIVGLGGGSAMDCAKGINFLLTNGGGMEDYWGFARATQPLLPSLGVPTTAGTGSEAQSYALISHAETHRKMACGDPGARFKSVILDPHLTATAPRPVAAAAGLDAVAHAVESHVSQKATPDSKALSREAWRRLAASLEPALGEAPGDEDLGAVLLGAHLAGAAIEQSMLGAAHACANPLTARYGLRHGEAVALMLPHVVRYNGQVASEGYRELAEAARIPTTEDPVEALAAFLEGLRDKSALPGRLRELDVPHEDLSDLANIATAEWTGRFNPRQVGADEFMELYESAY